MIIHVPRPRKEFMRVPTAIRDCVGFVAEATQPRDATDRIEYDPFGTGFVVSVDGHYGSSFFYFVTAAHLFRNISEERVAIILNKKGGGVTQIRSYAKWHRHPDPSVDVKVLPFDYERDYDVLAVPASILLRSEWLGDKSNIGLGSDVFSVGLFSMAPGESRNIPLFRYGNIAMLPDSAIQVEGGFSEVYLIEARSIGGISGSPVFVIETVSAEFADATGSPQRIIGLGPRCKLLGLMHGHWDIDQRELNNPKITPISHSSRMGVNLGIGVVVPAPKILEILYGSELTEQRNSADLEVGRRMGMVPHAG
jgi:hypothetical protein